MAQIQQLSKTLLDKGMQPSSGENHVMVYHNNMSTLNMFAEIFRKLGFLVSNFSDRSKALLKLSQEHFDLVFTDLDMPQLDGYWLAKQIKSQNSKIKIIIMTCRCQAEISELMNEDAVDFWLFKPFDTKVLSASLAEIDREVGYSSYHLMQNFNNLHATY